MNLNIVVGVVSGVRARKLGGSKESVKNETKCKHSLCTSRVADTSDNANSMVPLDQLSKILTSSGYNLGIKTSYVYVNHM